jgi:hypothetical protein
MAQAHAELKREQVDAYIRPVFDRFNFVIGPNMAGSRRDAGERITDPRQLYLSEDEAQCAAFYAACDVAHREHGFTGEHGFCPALVAEALLIDAQNALLRSGCDLLGLDDIPCMPKDRAKMLDLLFGACIKAGSEQKRAA